MHTGPVNRGVEIDSEIADSGRSVILEQVTNGLAVRMAVLFPVNGGKGPQEVARIESRHAFSRLGGDYFCSGTRPVELLWPRLDLDVEIKNGLEMKCPSAYWQL
jgi:hypothetical protein